jgi:hypothetical protein
LKCIVYQYKLQNVDLMETYPKEYQQGNNIADLENQGYKDSGVRHE